MKRNTFPARSRNLSVLTHLSIGGEKRCKANNMNWAGFHKAFLSGKISAVQLAITQVFLFK